MPGFLNFDDSEFDQHFDEILNSVRDASWDVNSVVSDILVDVKKRGDEALIQLTDRFDKIKLSKEELSFSKKEIDELSAKIKTTYFFPSIPTPMIQYLSPVGSGPSSNTCPK